jgi:RNA polymerase sigma factor (sigma-70 family)
MKKVIPSSLRRTRSVVAAMLVGAALSTGSSAKTYAATTTAPTLKAVDDITRHCQACWRNARLHPDSWSDCTQEVLKRLLERVEPTRWGDVLKLESEERREFVRAIDAVKKRTQRSRKFTGLAEDLSDHRTQPESDRNELREQVEKASQEVLSHRQQRIVQLSCAGWSIPEIAGELQTSVERVSDEKYKAIRKLRRHLGVSA